MESESLQKGAQWLETLGYVLDKQDWKPALGWSPKVPQHHVLVWYCIEKDQWSADEFLTYTYLRGHATADMSLHSWYATPQEALQVRIQAQLEKQTEHAEIALQEVGRLESNLREVTNAVPLSAEECKVEWLVEWLRKSENSLRAIIGSEAPLSETEWLRKSLREAITRQDLLRKALQEAGIPDPTLK